jgi:hypothetical protein
MTVPNPVTHGIWTKSFAPSMAHSMTSGGPPIRMATHAIFLAKAIEPTRRRLPLTYLLRLFVCSEGVCFACTADSFGNAPGCAWGPVTAIDRALLLTRGADG